jgi:hypothetical protein
MTKNMSAAQQQHKAGVLGLLAILSIGEKTAQFSGVRGNGQGRYCMLTA